MGNKSSKKPDPARASITTPKEAKEARAAASKEAKKTREEKAQAKAESVEVSIQKIAHVQKKAVESVSQQLMSPEDVLQVIQITEISKAQLRRGGETLTKSDYVAILVALTKDKGAIQAYTVLTNNDLITMIRKIIYDPAFFGVSGGPSDNRIERDADNRIRGERVSESSLNPAERLTSAANEVVILPNPNHPNKWKEDGGGFTAYDRIVSQR